MPNPLTPSEQFDCLMILDFLSDLFTATKQETFSRAEILVLLNNVRSDPRLIDPLVAEAYALTTEEIELP